jgi:hypothetical protein
VPNDPWSDAHLDAMRQVGDVEVDPMAKRIISRTPFDPASGRLGYHKLLGLADLLLKGPELLLLDHSFIGRELKNFPQDECEYFDPLPVPEWVDAKRLERASEIWDENMLAIIGVLYAGSLPSCYLIANGIPTLYDTGKLGEHRFIYQRIYETGLMLDAVMEPDGLKLVEDLPGPDGQPCRRYVWGRGFIAARKVRMLHAAMRCMLLEPQLVMPPEAHRSEIFARSSIGALTAHIAQKPYDAATLGKPVNQEDLIYTLLTFGYTIPVGLRTWGCRLSDKDCEAFLHAWCLVGHIMGVRDELLPETFADAERLYAIIKRRQARRCVQGPKLTSALEDFLRDYLPGWMKRDLPFMLIRTQLTPEEAEMIRPAEVRRPPWWMRLITWVGFATLWWYYLAKWLLVRRFPPLRMALGRSFALAGEALIDSWRDGYERRPFYIPGSINGGWQREAGMDEAMQEKLRTWRRSLFSTVLWGVALVMLGTLLAVGSAVALVFVLELPTWIWSFTPVAVIACWAGAFTFLTSRVKRVVARRPGPKVPGNPDLR